jgi:transposase
MRGEANRQVTMLSLRTPEQRVPADHPLRRIKSLADWALGELSALFGTMYSDTGRPSIPPERLLKASLLIAFYSVRSDRLFCEQLDYNLLFRWFLDMNGDEPSFDHSSFTHNRRRLLDHDVARQFFKLIVEQARRLGLISDEHFSVDGSLIEAWASLKSFRPKASATERHPDDNDPGNPSVDFHGERRSNQSHQSTTDPEARLAKKGKGKEAKLCYSLNHLMENRNGLLVDTSVTIVTGAEERHAALAMLSELLPWGKRRTVGGDKGFDTAGFVAGCRELAVTAHVAQNSRRPQGSAIDARTTHWPGYELSQRARKRIEEIFGWNKTVGNFRKTRFIGRLKTQLWAYLEGTAYNLMRIAKLCPA